MVCPLPCSCYCDPTFYRRLAQKAPQAGADTQKARDSPTRPYPCTSAQLGDHPHVPCFSKNFYTAGISNYFQFYTIKTFGFTNAEAQLYLFYYLGAAAAGTLIGGFFGDRVGRKFIIWFSILGAAPFALWLPYADAKTTAVLVVLIGFIISSAFASILVYAQELLPKKIGMISGVFYGFAFGMAGLGSAVLGKLIDMTSITFVYKVCSFLPLMGLTAYFLPNLRKVKTKLSE